MQMFNFDREAMKKALEKIQAIKEISWTEDEMFWFGLKEETKKMALEIFGSKEIFIKNFDEYLEKNSGTAIDYLRRKYEKI